MKKNNWLIIMVLLMSSLLLSGCGETSSSTTTTTETTDSDSSGTDLTDVETGTTEDSEWDDEVVIDIVLNGATISTEADAVTLSNDETVATITAGGTYQISGTLDDGQIIVDNDDGELVRLILNGAEITCTDNAPLYIANADEAIIVLVADSDNTLTDGDSYTYEDDEDEPDATLFSNDDLTIYGDGSLTVNGNYNEGIRSKDGLIIQSGTITVTAVDHGIKGKDYLTISGGDLTVQAGGDGLKSNNDEDEDLGYVYISGGTINLTADGDGIQAETQVIITGGEFDINSGDDGINATTAISISDGEFEIASGDDAIHSDLDLDITGGTIEITESVEGIEGADIIIADADITVTASDDGINGSTDDNSNAYLDIDGGRIAVYAAGDGIDVNGYITMTDGTVLVHGPTSSSNGAIDFDNSFSMTGGVLLAAGTSMAQAPTGTSDARSVIFKFASTQAAETVIHFATSSGEELFTFAPEKSFKYLIYASDELAKGNYRVYVGGTASGAVSDGLYEEGGYSSSSAYSQVVTILVNSTSVNINN